MTPPSLSDEQRAAALAKAAEVRRVRAEVKQLLKMGAISFAEVLERAEQDEMVAGIKVYAVLSSLPGFGKVRAKRLMEQLDIADSRRLRGLGRRQRAGLLETLS